MIQATIVSTPDCHLCERARRILSDVGSPDVRLTELDWESPEGRALVTAEGVPFPPAVFVAGELVGYGRLSEGALRKRLAAVR